MTSWMRESVLAKPSQPRHGLIVSRPIGYRWRASLKGEVFGVWGFAWTERRAARKIRRIIGYGPGTLMSYENTQTNLLDRARNLNLRLGRWSKALAWGYSWCGRCETPWRFVQGHSTSYTEGRACFPLCEKCWSDLTINERLPYYRELWEKWDEGYAEWENIRAAVEQGL